MDIVDLMACAYIIALLIYAIVKGIKGIIERNEEEDK